MLLRRSALIFVLCACGGGDSSQPDASADGAPNDVAQQETAVEAAPPKVDAGYPGPHPAAPQVQTLGGAVLAAPNVVPIFFANDPDQTPVETFLGQLASSTFWPSAVAEYGV